MEIWKTIPGYDKYKVSNLGRIKSLKYKEPKILKKKINIYGYEQIALTKNSKKKYYQVHQLVAMAFLNHKPCGHKIVVDHIDFDRTNNTLQNLRLTTQRENTNKKHLKSSSKYTGVYWDKKSDKWRSMIRINGKLKYLGLYENEYDAYLSYKKELKKIG